MRRFCSPVMANVTLTLIAQTSAQFHHLWHAIQIKHIRSVFPHVFRIARQLCARMPEKMSRLNH